MEEKEIRKDNKGFIITIIILVIIIIGMGLYIAYDKGIIFDKVEKETKKSNTTKINKKENKDLTDSSNEIKALDLKKCLNNKNNTYSNEYDGEADVGLSINVNSDRKSATLNIDWSKFGPHSTASTWSSSVETYQITGFSKNIQNTYIGVIGQDAMGITLFYLMNDGTVEYTPIFIQKTDSQNNTYYDMNYSSANQFSTNGTIAGVANVIKFYTVNASNGSGWLTTIGATRDGSFYDLGAVIMNN